MALTGSGWAWDTGRAGYLRDAGVAVEDADGEFTGIKRVNQRAQVSIGIIADDFGVGFLGSVDIPRRAAVA